MDSSSFSNPSSCMSTSLPNNTTVKEEKKKNKKRSGGAGGACSKLSTDPQSVAARQRRHRISDRFKILQSLVPGGSKLDTVSMLEEAIQYVKFLKAQIWLHQAMIGGLVDHDVNADDDPPPPPPANNIINNCSVVPFHHDQHIVDYSWFYGEGNGA